MKDLYPHFGLCFNCSEQRDLNQNLYCKECEARRAILDRVSFQQALTMPSNHNPHPIPLEFIIDVKLRKKEK